jgi:DtxR family Mn-dependent transcriptional regulator
VRFTPKGRNESRKIIRRHRLAERLLHDVLEVGEDEMESAACKFEHIISEGVEESICTLLGHPKICPHGKPMPQGKCCRERKKITERIVSSLSELKKGQYGKIVYILTKNHKNLQKLLGMGVLPGMTVEIIQRYPSHVFQIGQTQIAVDTDIANDIYVRII